MERDAELAGDQRPLEAQQGLLPSPASKCKKAFRLHRGQERGVSALCVIWPDTLVFKRFAVSGAGPSMFKPGDADLVQGLLVRKGGETI